MVIYVVCYDLSASLATRILVLDIGKEMTEYVHSSPLLFYISNLFVNSSCRLRDKLALMQHVEVCCKLVGRQDENTMYLFPRLGCYSGFFVFLISLFLFFFSSFSLLFLFFFWFILLPIPILVLINFLTNIADNFGFKTSQTHKKFHFAGLRVTAPSNRVFTSGSFSPLLVVIFAALNVSMSYIFFFYIYIYIFE